MSITRSQVVCGHRYLTDAVDAFSKNVWELHTARPAAILDPSAWSGFSQVTVGRTRTAGFLTDQGSTSAGRDTK